MTVFKRTFLGVWIGLLGGLSSHAWAAVPVKVPPATMEALAPGAGPSNLEMALLASAPTLRQEALHAALSALESLESRGESMRPLLTVIDYSLPSTAKRMWVFDLSTRMLLFHEMVAHGRNSGEDMTVSFSNEEGSLMTSLGAFVTGTTYTGKNGYSLRLRGMDPGLNDRAEARTIVMHGAPYVSEDFVHRVGRIGRSWGCPAVRTEIAQDLIDRLKDGTLLYAWHPSLTPPLQPAAATASAAVPSSAPPDGARPLP